MVKNKEKEERWGMLWQGSSKISSLEIIQQGLEYFKKKYKKEPVEIGVNVEVRTKDFKECDGVPLVVDRSMYNKNIIYIMIN